MMDEYFILPGIILLLIMLPLFYRVIVGPTAFDRIMAVNIIGTKTTLLLIFIGTIYQRVEMFVDFAMTYALLNFIASLAAAKYFHKTQDASSNPEAA